MDAFLTAIVSYLATQSWQIAVLIVVVEVAAVALRRRSAHVRYLLWLIVLVKCLVPPLHAVPLAVVPERASVGGFLIPVQSDTIDGRWSLSNTAPRDPACSELRESARTAPNARATWDQTSVYRLLGVLWILGAGIHLTRNLLRAVRGHRRLRLSRRALPDNATVDVKELLSAYGVRHLPRIWIVDDFDQPFVWGLVRGQIYVPATFLAIQSEKQRREILGHELSHVLRFDAAVSSLQVIAQALFWFHLFVWWANRRMRQEREKCCDEMTVAHLRTRPQDYCQAILEMLAGMVKSAHSAPSLV